MPPDAACGMAIDGIVAPLRRAQPRAGRARDVQGSSGDVDRDAVLDAVYVRERAPWHIRWDVRIRIHALLTLTLRILVGGEA